MKGNKDLVRGVYCGRVFLVEGSDVPTGVEKMGGAPQKMMGGSLSQNMG